jgi:hypothetical protein
LEFCNYCTGFHFRSNLPFLLMLFKRMLQIYLHREEGTTKAIYSSLRSAAAEKQSVRHCEEGTTEAICPSLQSAAPEKQSISFQLQSYRLLRL